MRLQQQVKFWENDKHFGNTSQQACFTTDSFFKFYHTFLSVSTTQKQLGENVFNLY